MRPELAELLQKHLANKAPTAPAFNAPEDRRQFAGMFKADLAATGILYCDKSGRYADFHGLRHTFISNLANGGVHPKVAQALARHSTITLTMDRYTHQYHRQRGGSSGRATRLVGPAGRFGGRNGDG